MAASVLLLGACSSGTSSSDSSSAAAPSAAASTSAAASAASGTKVRIAYLQKQGDQQYFVDQANGAKDMAAQLGADITVVNLGDDAAKAISELDTVIAQGYNAIAIVVPDQKIGPQVIDAAKKAGVTLIASDDSISDAAGNPAPFVGFNGADMGTKVGTKAGELFKASGWDPAETAILRVSKEDLTACEDRANAAGEAFKTASGADVKIIPVGTDATAVDSQNKAAAVITANPDVKKWVVYGCNDESETGAVAALANAGFGADAVIGVGLGAYLTCKDWLAKQETGNKAALYISGVDVGKSAVSALVDAVANGKPLPPETVAPTTMVDATNFEAAGVKCT